MQKTDWHDVIVTKFQWLIKLMKVKTIPNPNPGATETSRHKKPTWVGAYNAPQGKQENEPGAPQGGEGNGNEGRKSPEVIQID